MSDENKQAAGSDGEAKKTRRTGINKVDVKIETAEDAGAFLTAFRTKVVSESAPTKTYNHGGFASLAYEDIEADGLLKMIICASDALAKKDQEIHTLASQIVANTSRRQVRSRIIADYKQMAARMKMGSDLDGFAKKQTNGKTNKHFKDFDEMIDLAVEGELSGEVAEAVEAA